jgi:hypothetical protein
VCGISMLEPALLLAQPQSGPTPGITPFSCACRAAAPCNRSGKHVLEAEDTYTLLLPTSYEGTNSFFCSSCVVLQVFSHYLQGNPANISWLESRPYGAFAFLSRFVVGFSQGGQTDCESLSRPTSSTDHIWIAACFVSLCVVLSILISSHPPIFSSTISKRKDREPSLYLSLSIYLSLGGRAVTACSERAVLCHIHSHA